MMGNQGKLGAPRTSLRGKVCVNRKDTIRENDKIVTSPSAVAKIAQICNYGQVIPPPEAPAKSKVHAAWTCTSDSADSSV